MMKTLKEIYFNDPNPLQTESTLSQMLEPWSGQQYGELGAILGMLEGLYVLFQKCHWITQGQSFYSDHLLYQRIYETIREEIDAVGEKSVGLGSPTLVSAQRRIKGMDKFIQCVEFKCQQTYQHSGNVENTYAKKALVAEKMFIETTTKLIDVLKQQNLLTRGLDNHLSDLLDSHEAIVYLLKQRTKDL